MNDPRERTDPMRADELALAFESSRTLAPSDGLRQRLLERAAERAAPTPEPRRSRWRPRLLNAAALFTGFLPVWYLGWFLERERSDALAHERVALQAAAEVIHGTDHTDTHLLLALATLADQASASERRTAPHDTRESQR